MQIEQQKETSPKFSREIEWVNKQVKEELKRFNKEKFYEKDGEEIKYNMDTVKQYLWVLKEKKTWKELISKNSSAMVMAVQIALYSQNYSFWTIDWILWDKTKAAIRKFQADNNLPVDTLWRAMPSTIEKLLEVISRKDKVEIPEEEKQEAEEIMEEKEEKEAEKSNNLNTQSKWTVIENEQLDNNTKENETKPDKWDVSSEKNETEEKNDETEKERDQLEKIKNRIKNRDYDKFKELTKITQEEAEAIHQYKNKEWKTKEILYSFFLPLSWVKEVTPETFEELLKHKWVLEIWIETLTPWLAQKIVDRETETNIWENITFSWLKTLNLEVCEILWDTKWILTFDALETISADEMWKLIWSLSADETWTLIWSSWQRIYFNAIKEIDPKVAEKIANSPRDIHLNWITHIDSETAQKLSEKKTWKIYLENLEAVIDRNEFDYKKIYEQIENLNNTQLENIEALSKIPNLKTNINILWEIRYYKMRKDRQWKNLSETVEDVVHDRSKINELSKMENLTHDDAEYLVSNLNGRYLDLSWIKEITPDTFETLLQYKWGLTIWIETLTPALAEKLEWKWKSITFSWLIEIEDDAYEKLWKARWVLQFNVLNIREKIWELIKNSWWRIYFKAIDEITPNMAEKIAESTRDIYLDWVANIDLETAQKLSEKKTWELHLEWLTPPLSNEILDELANIPRSVLKLKQDSSIYKEINERRKKKEEAENN